MEKRRALIFNILFTPFDLFPKVRTAITSRN
jgi:hypothetical protein